MRENEERDRRARSAAAFEEGLGSSATREDFMRRAFDYLAPELTPVGRGMATGVGLGIEGLRLAVNLINQAAATGSEYATNATNNFLAALSEEDVAAIRAELDPEVRRRRPLTRREMMAILRPEL